VCQHFTTERFPIQNMVIFSRSNKSDVRYDKLLFKKALAAFAIVQSLSRDAVYYNHRQCKDPSSTGTEEQIRVD
jgi:hypothetical protein